MNPVIFVGGITLVVIAFSLAPMSKDDRAGLLRYLSKDAEPQSERRMRRLNTLLWLASLVAGLTMLGFSFAK